MSRCASTTADPAARPAPPRPTAPDALIETGEAGRIRLIETPQRPDPEAIRDLARAGVPAFADSYVVRELAAHPEDYPPGYLVHEFFHAGWRPIYVGDPLSRRTMAQIPDDPPR